MVIENNPSARMQVRSRGQLVAPACCCVCGNATCDEGYLDLNVFVDFHGTLYLCMNCVTQGAETCGLFTPQEVNHLQMQIESLLVDKERLTSELSDANDYISNFDSVLRTALSSSNLPDGSSVKDVLNTPEPTDNREPESEESVTLGNPSPTGGTKLRDITFE